MVVVDMGLSVGLGGALLVAGDSLGLGVGLGMDMAGRTWVAGGLCLFLVVVEAVAVFIVVGVVCVRNWV